MVRGNVSIKPAQICSILKACKAANVASFEFGELKVEFHPSGDAMPAGAAWEGEESPQASSFFTEPPDVPSKQAQTDAIDVALLAVEDPVEWERRQLEGHTDAEM